MRAGTEGEETPRNSSRSKGRKSLKSPFKIRDKIRELDQKLEKETMFRNLAKRKKESGREKQHNITKDLGAGSRGGLRRVESLGRPLTSKEKKERRQQLNLQLQTIRSGEAGEEPMSANSLNPHYLSYDEQWSEEQVTRLREQNQKYKQIYSSSVSKMNTLEERLKRIKEDHENEKAQLEQAIGQLSQKIKSKKIMIGHLFEYEQPDQNFLRVSDDRIIAETDNEYSSSNIEGPKNTLSIHQKKPSELSKLSVNSNGAGAKKVE